jgi:hypothetical protein
MPLAGGRGRRIGSVPLEGTDEVLDEWTIIASDPPDCELPKARKRAPHPSPLYTVE